MHHGGRGCAPVVEVVRVHGHAVQVVRVDDRLGVRGRLGDALAVCAQHAAALGPLLLPARPHPHPVHRQRRRVAVLVQEALEVRRRAARRRLRAAKHKVFVEIEERDPVELGALRFGTPRVHLELRVGELLDAQREKGGVELAAQRRAHRAPLLAAVVREVDVVHPRPPARGGGCVRWVRGHRGHRCAILAVRASACPTCAHSTQAPRDWCRCTYACGVRGV